MIDYTNYTYAKIGNFTNVMVEIGKEKNTPQRIDIHHYLDRLIGKVSLEHPEWQFLGTDGYYGAGDVYVVNRFEVYEDNDKIGAIAFDGYNERTYKWVFHNERIRNARIRRGGMATGDLKKARKIIEEFFFAKTESEARAEAFRDARSVITNQHYQANRDFVSAADRLTPSVHRLLLAEYEDMRLRLLNYGATEDKLDKLVEAHAAREREAQLYTAIEANVGYVMIQRGNQYVALSPQTGDVVHRATNAELTPDVAAKLGILKMLTPKETVPDVGVRISSNTFYILP